MAVRFGLVNTGFGIALASAVAMSGTVLAQESAPAAEAVTPKLGNIRISSGEVTGNYFPLAGAICRVVNKESESGTCAVVPSSGSSANATNLVTQKTEFGLMQSRAGWLAQRKQAPFAEVNGAENLRAVLSLPGEQVLVLARDGANVKGLADLKGKRVNLGRPGSFQRQMAEMVLEAGGLSEGDLSPAVELELSEQGGALCEGNVDVAFFAGVHPMVEVEEVMEHCSVQAVPIKGDNVTNWIKRHGWVNAASLSKDSYGPFNADVPTIELRSLLVTNLDQSEADVMALLGAVHSNFTAFKGLHPNLSALERSDLSAKGMGMPLHPAATRFYKALSEPKK